MTNDGCCSSKSPLVCDLTAISAGDRARYNELRRIVGTWITGRRDLPDGLAIQIDADRIALSQLAEWISFERKCCPFFEFRIDIAPESGPVWLSLTGCSGVKEFISAAFAG